MVMAYYLFKPKHTIDWLTNYVGPVSSLYPQDAMSKGAIGKTKQKMKQKNIGEIRFAATM